MASLGEVVIEIVCFPESPLKFLNESETVIYEFSGKMTSGITSFAWPLALAISSAIEVLKLLFDGSTLSNDQL
jgi:hypothetical protein